VRKFSLLVAITPFAVLGGTAVFWQNRQSWPNCSHLKGCSICPPVAYFARARLGQAPSNQFTEQFYVLELAPSVCNFCPNVASSKQVTALTFRSASGATIFRA